MKKLFSLLLILVIMTMLLSSSVCATHILNDIQTEDSQILSFRQQMESDIQKFVERYGQAYGIVAYILNRLQVFSIPICFAGLAISGTLTYVINAKRMDQRQRGWNIMIGFLLFLVICQILPLAFALATVSWG